MSPHGTVARIASCAAKRALLSPILCATPRGPARCRGPNSMGSLELDEWIKFLSTDLRDCYLPVVCCQLPVAGGEHPKPPSRATSISPRRKGAMLLAYFASL